MQYLYIIQFGNEKYYKIGKAKSPRHRLYNLQCGSYRTLSIRKTWKGRNTTVDKVERLIHTYIDSRGDCKHMRGEWYFLSPYCLRELLQVNSIQDLIRLIKGQ